MKKLMALLLAMVMALSLAACGGKDDVAEDADRDEEIVRDEDENVEEDEEEAPQQEESEAFAGQVLLDNEDLLVTITGIEYDHESYFKMLFAVENRSSVRLSCTLEDICVNGNDYETEWTNSADAGATSDGALRFYYEDCLSPYGEERATCITFTLEVYDGDTFDLLYATDVTVYPYGEAAAE